MKPTNKKTNLFPASVTILWNASTSPTSMAIISVRHFGLSRSSLHRKLKALTDQSISELVRTIRLSTALELIREGKLNISEIAYQTGFSSISAFSRAFKRAYGKAPSEMRDSG
ncbi:MAG: helix-turn-helix transcriptional regulator [Lewinellaceae bacterium]|nr:helix-turn-helix transcriptional regulator [Lewinellaceae bacterium]